MTQTSELQGNESIPLESLSPLFKKRLLGKLNFMDDILSGKIKKPAGMTINTVPKPLNNLLKAVKAEMKNDQDIDDNKDPTSQLLSSPSPITIKPSLLFNKININNINKLNKHNINPLKYPLSNPNILSLQNNGYVIIDNFISCHQLIQTVQNDINIMNQNGLMKRAGMKKSSKSNKIYKNIIQISACATNEINGIYNQCNYNIHNNDNESIKLLIKYKYNILSRTYFMKNDEYIVIKIQTTNELSLFVSTDNCWIICKCMDKYGFPIIYYVTNGDDNDGLDGLDGLKWIGIGGVLPFGKLSSNNNWISSSIRNDLHCWVHSDDKFVSKSLKQCIISMDEIRVQLNKLDLWNSQDTQCQVCIYPGNGAKYITHIDEIADKNKIKKRKLTVLLYFNLFDNNKYDKLKDGGCLRIYLGNNKSFDIEPLGGRLVLFNSQWLPHQVLPTYFNRYSVTLWLY